MKKIELLVPAGDLETFKVAIDYGADAIYIGGQSFSLRAKAPNFNYEEMKEAILFAKKRKVKVYVTANIYARNHDIDLAKKYFMELNELKPDAVLVSDLGMFMLAKKILKNIDIHISTQANTTNYQSVIMYKELGAKRVVLARELSIKEIKEIKQKVNDIEIECFVHGAMCISYSGRCLLSSFMTGRSSNYGLCTHPCRWKYKLNEKTFDLIEEERPNDHYEIFENENGTYIFNSKDLSMINHIDDLVCANIDSFKIEGRMKTALYVATITRSYRKALDDYYNNNEIYKSSIENYEKEIRKCTYRGYTTGFYYGMPDENSYIYENSTYIVGATFFGIVNDVIDGYAYLEQKNKFSVGDKLEVMHFDFTNDVIEVLDMIDIATNEKISSCPHAKQKIKVKFDKILIKGEIIRSLNEK